MSFIIVDYFTALWVLLVFNEECISVINPPIQIPTLSQNPLPLRYLFYILPFSRAHKNNKDFEKEKYKIQ